ncbi:MAG TPA: patatin-like phospholipase family protein [Chthoniobacterales bacterium]|nr:patatin-like phospholipase family protein [Chthoniobacterales bacterium]
MPTQRAETGGFWRWLQRPWWFVRDIIRALSPARFSFFVALVGGAIFLVVQQGTEILRGLAEPNPDSLKIDLYPVLFFFGALTTWALHSWYWSRVVLNLHISHAPPPHASSVRAIAWFRLHGPRILGVLPPFIVAVACFFIAPQGYSSEAPGHPRTNLYVFGGVALLLVIGLYVFFILRRRWLDAGGKGASSPSDSAAATAEAVEARAKKFRKDPATWGPALAFFLFSLVLLFLFLSAPIRAGLFIGSGAILCLAATSWVCLGSLIVLLTNRLRLPLIGLLIAWAMLCSLWNDNHRIRTVSIEPPLVLPADSGKPPVQHAFATWHEAVQKAYPLATNGSSPAVRPVFIVATEGGGIRAAYWTALVLAALEDQSLDQRKAWSQTHPGQPPPPDFVSHLFAVSGVSGGSLGAVVFNALVAENVAYPMKDRAHDILRQDFLSPTLAAMFFPDLIQRFLPFRIPPADRGGVLEKAWEYGWERTISGQEKANDQPNRLGSPLRKLWSDWRGNVPLPALFLNGTRVESGKRIITSNVSINPGSRIDFADAEDAEVKLGNDVSHDMPLSTAAHMSARFTYVSPAGLLPDGGHVVDGGYFENSGAATALEVLYEVEAAIQSAGSGEVVVPVIIEIRNGPTKEKPDITSAAATPAPSDKQEFLSEALAPVSTLLNTRDARGTFSQAAIKSEQDSVNPQLANWFLIGLHESPVPLPLGWMLSGDAANEMRSQLDDNQKVFDSILAELSGQAPSP